MFGSGGVVPRLWLRFTASAGNEEAVISNKRVRMGTQRSRLAVYALAVGVDDMERIAIASCPELEWK